MINKSGRPEVRFSNTIRLIYFAFIAWVCVSGPLSPFGNYDMLPYVGAALSFTGQTGELRSRSLTEVKKYVSSEQYNSIISGSDFREVVARDDRAFIEQLPAYRVKPLYVLLTALLGAAAGNIALASVLISAAGFLIIGFLLYLLRPTGPYEPVWFVSVLGLLCLGNPPFILLSRVSTPDSLAAGLMLIGFWAYLKQPQSVYPAALMSLAILARPDSVITTACLFPLFLKFSLDGKVRVKWLLGSTLTPIAVYLLGKVFFPGLGLVQLLIYTLKGPFIHISDMDTSQLRQLYFPALFNDVMSLLTLPRFVVFLIASLGLLAFTRNPYAKFIVLAALGNATVKIALFPNFDNGFQERYFLLSYILVLFAAFNGQKKPILLDGRGTEASIATSG